MVKNDDALWNIELMRKVRVMESKSRCMDGIRAKNRRKILEGRARWDTHERKLARMYWTFVMSLFMCAFAVIIISFIYVWLASRSIN